MRLITRLLAFALVLGPISAYAQNAPSTGQTQPRQTFQEHFDSANITHDGHLTLDQAKAAKWTAVVRRFEKIDADHKGYITAQQLRDQFARERAEKARANGTAPAANAGPKS